MRPVRGDLALGVARCSRRAPSRATRLIALGQRHQVSLGLRGPADEHQQQAGGERVERAGVPGLDAAERAPHRGDDVVRGHARRACRSAGRRPSGAACGPRRSGDRPRRACPSGRVQLRGDLARAGTRSAPSSSSVVEKPAARRCPPPPWARAIAETSTSSSVARSETLRWPRALAARAARARAPRPSCPAARAAGR